MATLPENFAPYASIGNMLLVLKQIRKGWTPSRIDGGDLERIGITKSTVNRTLAALQYLGLIEEDGLTSDNTWKALATASVTEYPKVLEGILRGSYVNIFELFPDPGEASDAEIGNAFRKNEPLMQRDRMISLFRGLCQEAGIISGEPLTREQKPQPSQSARKEPAPKSEKRTLDTSWYATPFAERVNPALQWYKDLEPLMMRLPKSGDSQERPHWTDEEKTRWFTAFQSMLDLLIETRDET